MALQGTVGLVTGAGRGLGAALAFALAENGCTPILAGRNVDALKRVAENIHNRFGISPGTLRLDLADPHNVAVAIHELRANYDAIRYSHQQWGDVARSI